MKTALALLLLAQLVTPKGPALPQILSAKFSSPMPLRAGHKTDVNVVFTVKPGYKINKEPHIALVVTPITGVQVEKKSMEASGVDAKSKDEYFVNLPTMKVGVTAAKRGKYELPGKLTYFFCSTADGFCSKQTVDVKIPLLVE